MERSEFDHDSPKGDNHAQHIETEKLSGNSYQTGRGKEGTSTQALYCDQSKMYMTKHKQGHFNQQGSAQTFLTAP